MPKLLPISTTDKSHIGLAIASQSITAVALDSKLQPTLHAQVQSNAPYAKGSWINGPILTQSLLELKSKMNFTTNRVAVCFPEKFAFSRDYSFPKLNQSEIDEALNLQLEKLFPYATEDIYTDWRLLKETASETKIAITAVPKTIIDGIKDSLHIVSLFPLSFEPSVSALARLIPSDITNTVLIIEIDIADASSSIILGGVVQVTATSFFRATDPQEKKAATIGNSVINLLKHWLKEQPESQFSYFVTGEGVTQGTLTALEQGLKIKTQTFTTADLGPAYHIAYSAVIGTIRPPDDVKTINILPQGLERYYESVSVHQTASQIRNVTLSLAIASAVLALIGYLAIVLIATQKIAALDRLSSNGTANTSGSNLELITRNATRYKRLFDRKTTPEFFLSSLLVAIPPETILKNITYDAGKNTLTLVGRAPDRESILTIHKAIMQTDLFKQSDIPLSSLSTSATGDFIFELEPKQT